MSILPSVRRQITHARNNCPGILPNPPRITPEQLAVADRLEFTARMMGFRTRRNIHDGLIVIADITDPDLEDGWLIYPDRIEVGIHTGQAPYDDCARYRAFSPENALASVMYRHDVDRWALYINEDPAVHEIRVFPFETRFHYIYTTVAIGRELSRTAQPQDLRDEDHLDLAEWRGARTRRVRRCIRALVPAVRARVRLLRQQLGRELTDTDLYKHIEYQDFRHIYQRLRLVE